MSELPQTATLFSVSYVGDLVTATLTLDMIARRCTGGVQVVTAPAGAALLAADPAVASVQVVRSSRAWLWRVEVARELWRARRRDAQIVNCEVYLPRWHFVTWLARALGLRLETLDLPALLADNQRSAQGQPTQQSHRSNYYARAVGLDAATPPLRVHLRAGEQDAVRERLVGLGCATDRPLIVVHPGSNDARRRPRTDHLAAVVGQLARDGNACVLLVGVPSEAALTLAVRQQVPAGVRLVDGCGLLDLRGLLASIAGAALFVGGDSGPLKLAEAVGTPTLSFWTPGAPAPDFAGPRGAGHVMLPADGPPQDAALAARSLIDRSRPRG